MQDSDPVRPASKAMQRRRKRILEEAKNLIAQGGIDALSIRTLADAADVAIRTIYRLIGTKDEVLIELFAQSQEQWKARITSLSTPGPLEMVEALSVEAAALFAEDEEYHRSAYLAIEHLYEAQIRHPAVIRVYEHAEELMAAAFKSCSAAGLLQNQIHPEVLGKLVLRANRNRLTDWAAGRITLGQMRDETLQHVYIILLADGTPAFRKVVRKRLEKVTTALA